MANNYMPKDPDQLEAMIKDADENGANYRVPIDWRFLGPKFLAMWRAAEAVEHEWGKSLGWDRRDSLRNLIATVEDLRRE